MVKKLDVISLFGIIFFGIFISGYYSLMARWFILRFYGMFYTDRFQYIKYMMFLQLFFLFCWYICFFILFKLNVLNFIFVFFCEKCKKTHEVNFCDFCEKETVFKTNIRDYPEYIQNLS